MKATDFSTTVKTKILPRVGEQLGVKNLHAIPRIEKVKVAVGVGKIARKGGSSAAMDEATIKKVSKNIAAITGQHPRVHLSKQAISNFKLRMGMPIGISVTLRGPRAYDFISKLVNIALPRVRDFRGLKRKSFDGNGNYSLGLRDYSVFPEVQPEDVEQTHGLEVTVVTTTKSDEAGFALLAALGFPFQKDTSKEEAVEEARKKAEAEGQQAAEEATLAAGLTKEEKPKVEAPAEGEAEKPADDSKKQDSEKEVKDSKK